MNIFTRLPYDFIDFSRLSTFGGPSSVNSLASRRIDYCSDLYFFYLIFTTPKDVYQQILHALIEWRDLDGSRDDPNEKIERLLDVLTSEEIGQNELADKLARDYNLS